MAEEQIPSKRRKLSIDEQNNSNESIFFEDSDVGEAIDEKFEMNLDTRNERRQMSNNLMKHFIRFNQTYVELVETAKLMNSVPGAKVKLPITKCKLIHEFLSQVPDNVYKYIFCESCREYSKCCFKRNNDQYKCKKCLKHFRGKIDDYFVHIEVENQLKRIVSRHWDDIQNYKQKFLNKKNDDIEDFYDGQAMKFLIKDNVFTLTINTDGVSIENSNSKSLWPILYICNSLPPNLRYLHQNIIVSAFYYGENKPNMMEYFRPAAENFENIQSNGIEIKQTLCRFFVIMASMDLPAKCDVQGIKHYTGYDSCGYCEIKGVHTATGIKFPAIKAKLRTQKDFINIIEMHPKEPTKGIKGHTPMIVFDNFHLIKSFAIDSMHQIAAGVMAKLVNFFVSYAKKKLVKQSKKPRKISKNLPSKPLYSLSKKNRDILNKRIKSIRPCTYITRKPRDLKYMSIYKASEWKFMLLYYLPVCLIGILPKRYIQLLWNLSSATYILSKTKITKDELKSAEEKLRKFVNSFQHYFGINNMVMNVHLLIHLADCVRFLGPLWVYSLYEFESFNGKLKNYAKQSQDILSSVAVKFILESSMKKEERKPRKNGNLDHPINDDLPKEEINLLHKSNIQLENEIKFNVFLSVWINGTHFTSMKYQRPKKTINYFVQTKDNKYGKIKYFIYKGEEALAIIKEYRICNSIIHINEFELTNENFICPVNLIREQLIYMYIRNKHYAVARPNVYERD